MYEPPRGGEFEEPSDFEMGWLDGMKDAVKILESEKVTERPGHLGSLDHHKNLIIGVLVAALNAKSEP